jgi:hydrogenase maturation protease
MAPLVVIGIGNILLRDDGVGVRVVEALERLAAHDRGMLPAGTRLVDGGTLDADLLAVVDGARAVLVIDAVDTAGTPGEVVVLREDAIMAAGARRPGGRTGGVGELVALARLMGWLTGPVGLVGIQVAEVGFHLGLSPRVEAAIPTAVETARRTLLLLDAEAAAGCGSPGGPARSRGAAAMEAVR